MSNDSTSIIKTKLGNFTIKSKKKVIIKIYPSKEINNIYKKNNYHNEIGLDIDKLLINKKKLFKYKCCPKGTQFQLKVWKEIKKIDYGKTSTYKKISKILNTSPRAVGNACASNTCLFIIPCHRVLRSDGKVGGYVLGENVKNYLLNIEKNGK